MKLYYVYPFLCPFTNELVDDYECLKKKYLSAERYSDYWNSCLRILCRKYGLAIGCSFNKNFENLMSAHDGHNPEKFKELLSKMFKSSLSYKKMFCDSESSFWEKKIKIDLKFNDLMKEVTDLLSERTELCFRYEVRIFPDIKRVNHHPTVAGEMWEGGHLINEENVYLHLINEIHCKKIKR